jgi:ABC-type transport system involved in cytochrome bd biosynthesis fused ATPase/permease subunit
MLLPPPTTACLQLLRSTTEQMKQLQESAIQAKAALATIQAEADQRIAAKEAAAQAQVESYKQKWHEEFDKRRKLHNLVSIHMQLALLAEMSGRTTYNPAIK